MINFLFWILTTEVSSQHKIPVVDPLSGSWHACFSIFMIIFGDATISNIFQIWSSDFNRIQSPKKSTINKNILTQSFPIDSDHRWSDRATFLTRRDIPRELYDTRYIVGKLLRVSEIEKDCRVPERIFPRDFHPALYKEFINRNGIPWTKTI